MSKIYRIVRFNRPSDSVSWINREVLWEGIDLFEEKIEQIYNPRFDKPIRYGILTDIKIVWEISLDFGNTWEETLPPRELVMQFSILGVRRKTI